MAKTKEATKREISVEDKLRALFDLQFTDAQIDRIRTIRGELPLEVQDLEDEIAGLDTRIQRKNEEVKALEGEISGKKNLMKEAATLIAKYEQQQANVRNNREFDSLSKEIEYQSLEIQLSEKRIKEFKSRIEVFQEEVESLKARMEEKKSDLEHKKSELDTIIAETQKDEEALIKKSDAYAGKIEQRYLSAYRRIRENAFNGLAVVSIDRDSCGGCFNKIPPQRQLDIAQRKKILVCEHCGRILVDSDLALEEQEKLQGK